MASPQSSARLEPSSGCLLWSGVGTIWRLQDLRVVAFLPARSYESDQARGHVTLHTIFVAIWGERFPLETPDFPVFIRLELEPMEAGIPLALELELIDADGAPVMKAAQPTRIDLPPPAPGDVWPALVDTFYWVREPVFPQPGSYSFHLWLNGEAIAHYSLSVQQV